MVAPHSSAREASVRSAPSHSSVELLQGWPREGCLLCLHCILIPAGGCLCRTQYAKTNWTRCRFGPQTNRRGPRACGPLATKRWTALELIDVATCIGNGKPVEVRHFVLTRGQKIWAVVVALSVIAGGVGSCTQGAVLYNDWACREGLPALTCPAEQVEEQPEGA